MDGCTDARMDGWLRGVCLSGLAERERRGEERERRGEKVVVAVAARLGRRRSEVR